jgi:ParB family transcriptional regulator, chromosome partitioning protein
MVRVCYISGMTNQTTATLPINNLQPNPFQPRDKVKKEDLDDLVESIKTFGILEPLVVAETPAGYQIIAGERRWRAAKIVGLTDVPVHIRKTTPKGMLEMAIVENVQRTDLNPIERAQAFQRLIREFGLTTGQVAQRVSKSAPYVSNTLKLLELPDAISDGLLGQQITEGHARALLGIDDEREMIECYKIILKENASVRRAEELARRFKEIQGSDSGKGRPITQPDEEIKAWEAKFKQYFTRPAALRLVRTRNQTRISIILKGSPESTQQDLEKILKLSELGA